jgi:hypothetical protein
MILLGILIALAGFWGMASAVSLAKRSVKPAIGDDFADPAILMVDGIWFAYATGANGVNVQLAASADEGKTWTRYRKVDGLPNLPGWVDRGAPFVWAPQVVMIVSLKVFWGGD